MTTRRSSPSADLAHPPYRADIDGLRAVAVLSVVAFHAFPTWVPGGFVGVDIFFVISGFLISMIVFASSETNTFSFRTFYGRRIRRIFPALALLLAVCLAAGWLVLLAEEYRQLGKHAAAGAGFSANFALWRESGYFDNDVITKPLAHLWSLGIEEQFYIAWPVLVWAVGRRPLLLVGATALIATLSFVLNVHTTATDSTAAFFAPQTRAWELLAGSLLAWTLVYRGAALSITEKSLDDHTAGRAAVRAVRLGGSALRNTLSIGALVVIAAAVLGLHKTVAFPGWWALLPVCGVALLITAGPDAWPNRVLLSSRAMVWIGLISYPLYLWHWPLLSFARILENETPSRSARIAAVAGSVVLAWLTYRFVERPLRFGPRPASKTVFLMASMSVIGAVGLVCWWMDGLHFRLAAEMRPSRDSAINAYAHKVKADPTYLAGLGTDRQNAIRAPYCHLRSANQEFAQFRLGQDRCLDVRSDRRNVLVLGDSHAADLYVGLSNAMPEVNFLQATGASCAPDHHYKAKTGCGELFDSAIAHAIRHGVGTIVIAGRWQGLDVRKLGALVADVRPFSRIYLVGPPAIYSDFIAKILQRRGWRLDREELVRRYLDKTVLDLNQEMGRLASTMQVGFIDRITSFCGPEGRCPLMSPEGDLYTADRGHLFRKGAYVLGERIRDTGAVLF